MSFSTSGLTALALASVVLMRSCWMTSLQRFASSALRCAGSRLSFPRCFWWRIGPSLVLPEVQAPRVERLDDLVDRLLAEVRDRRQLALGLRDEVAHRLDARALEAVVGADAELELLDEDVVHRPAGRARRGADRGRAAVRAARGLEDAARARAELLDAIGVGEDRQLLDEDLGRLAQRARRVDRAVGLDLERELVVVGALADARALDRIGDATHGREDRVDRDDADRLVGRLVLLRWAVAAPAPDRHVHLELGLGLQRRDVHVGVEDLHAGRQVDVLGRDVARARDDERRLDLGGVRVHAAHDALEVEDDVGHVLLDALDRRELVGDALDPDAGDGRTGERGEENAAQRVAERVAEAAIERLDRERAAVLVDAFTGDPGDLEVEHQVLVFRGWRPLVWAATGTRLRAPFKRVLLRVELDDELLLDRRRDLATLRLAQHLRRQGVVVGLKPGRHLPRELCCVADQRLGRRPRLHGDDVAVAHLVARDVDAAAVDRPVTVADHLARLPARGREAQPHEYVVEAALEHPQKVLARDPGLA